MAVRSIKEIYNMKQTYKHIQQLINKNQTYQDKDIYVLIRYYYPGNTREEFQKAIESVANNKKDYESHGGKVILIINDDTPVDRINIGEEILKECLAIEYNGIKFTLEDKGKNCYLFHTNGKGSAYATFCIREKFLELTEGKNDAIAVTLDQDDRLETGALRHIAKAMTKHGANIVVTPFKMQDPNGMDITDDGGRRHNMSSKHWTRTSNLSDLSSIGWTKSYNRSTLKQYQDVLKDFLNKERGDDGANNVESFFSNHRAYEDFIDFYALLLKDSKISGTSHITHIYNKHKGSITSSPKIEDFLIHRPAMLIALIDLCYFQKESLCSDFEYKLLRFILTKVYQIEHILTKYRNLYKKGDEQYAEFAAQTHDGYFINKLSRLMLGENRYNQQDRKLFKFKTTRNNKSKENIEKLFSVINLNSITEYHLNLDKSDSLRLQTLRYILRKAVECEKNKDKKSQTIDDEVLKMLMKESKTPKQKRLKSLNRWFWIWVVGGFIYLIFITKFKDNECDKIAQSISLFKELIQYVIPILVAVLTFLLNERSKAKVDSIEEESLKKLYYFEFRDFIRHLEANLKVMLQLYKELSKNPDSLRVEDIHFTNLSWPESSCLFSDDMAKIISKDRIDDFSRLKINLRNINNSAKWLQSVATSSPTNLLPDLEWEIVRYFGYLANMYYLKSHEFNFPQQNDLEIFLEENKNRTKFTDLFMDYPAKERICLVDFFLEKYFEDRRMKRSVLIR